jgi:hypothetical protein
LFVEGNDCLLISDLPAHLTVKKLAGEDEIECHLCQSSKKLKLKDMRGHVGKHILFKYRNLEQFSTLAKGVEIGLDPCGWCGRGGCMTQLTKKGNSYSTTSSCQYHYAKMMYGKAMACSNSAPCPICPKSTSGQLKTIWKYNAMHHFISEHSPTDNALPTIPPEFLIETFITSREEGLMGVSTEVTSTWRAEHEIPPSDDVQLMRENVKRDRAESNVTQPPKKKPHRKS